jgi:hypothetical protein
VLDVPQLASTREDFGELGFLHGVIVQMFIDLRVRATLDRAASH